MAPRHPEAGSPWPSWPSFSYPQGAEGSPTTKMRREVRDAGRPVWIPSCSRPRPAPPPQGAEGSLTAKMHRRSETRVGCRAFCPSPEAGPFWPQGRPVLQEYLAHERKLPPLGTPIGPFVQSYCMEGGVSYERGTPAAYLLLLRAPKAR